MGDCDAVSEEVVDVENSVEEAKPEELDGSELEEDSEDVMEASLELERELELELELELESELEPELV